MLPIFVYVLQGAEQRVVLQYPPLIAAYVDFQLDVNIRGLELES